MDGCYQSGCSYLGEKSSIDNSKIKLELQFQEFEREAEPHDIQVAK